jgi:TPP-dependent pyruvate/acetoin dehydrogenase alpha subunit
MEPQQRTSDYGTFVGLSETIDTSRRLEIFRKICYSHFFEYRARQEDQAKNLAGPVYLAAGQESAPAAIAAAFPDAHVFGQHRGHALFLSFGGDPQLLIDELLGLPTGACGGMGGSIAIHDPQKRIYGHNGLIAEQVPIAVGAAYAKPQDQYVCFFGDAAVEEDYFFGGLGFAVSQKLPVLFVCEDNDLSVLTPTKDRRTWRMEEVARSLGLPAVDISDDPWLVFYHAQELKKQLPAYINIRTCRELWHAGSGQDAMAIEWNRWELTKSELQRQGLAPAAERIEAETKLEVNRLWDERLQMRSAKIPRSN